MLGAISYDPLVHIEVGPLSISPHGLGIAVGFVVAAQVMLFPRTRRMGISDDDVYPVLTRAAIGAVVGARLAYVANHASDFDSVLDAFKIWEGGISLLGGLFGAMIASLPAIRRRRWNLWRMLDLAAPGMALGIIIGRVGDLVVGDHLGKTTSFFLGYTCPPASVDTASPCVPGTVVHQTALYDLLLTSVLLVVLLRLRRRPHFAGFLLMVFGAWYGTQRIIEDFLREDVRRLGLTGSQMTAIVTVAVCLAWLVFVRRSPTWGRWDDADADPHADARADADADADTDAETASEPLVPSAAALATGEASAAAGAGAGIAGAHDHDLGAEPPPPRADGGDGGHEQDDQTDREE